MRRCLLIALLFCAFADIAVAQQVALQLDPSSTRVEYTLGDTLHTVHGSFRLTSGALTFDPATGKAGGVLVVDAASGESGNGSRDRKMTKEILEASKFPEITFAAHEVIGKLANTGASHLEVRGDFRIHGQDHPLILLVDAQSNADTADATTSFEVPYVAWGMKNPSIMFLKVSDKVSITIHTHAHLTQFAASR
jgi:polyisoprenoid-binding protein YceI